MNHVKNSKYKITFFSHNLILLGKIAKKLNNYSFNHVFQLALKTRNNLDGKRLNVACKTIINRL